MSSDNSTSSSEVRQRKRSKVQPRIRGKKTFQESWLENAKYKGWIAKSSDPNQTRCIACGKEFAAGTSELDKHANGSKHKKNVNALKITPTCSTFSSQRHLEHERSVKMAEIKICTYFAEHNIPIMAIDHFVQLLKQILPENKLVRDIQLKRTKCTEIIKNVISSQETNDLTAQLKKTQFSVLIDESTDICDKKNLCLLTKHVNETSGMVETRLLELIDVDAKDCSASKLYEEFKKCLKKFDIPIQNIIGVACDGANVMTGSKNSFFSHLKAEVPNVILMRCICHTSAIIASKACINLPRTSEDLMRAVYGYISGSAKRNAVLTEMQEYFNNNEKSKILKLSNTRWLSMHNCVVRMLTNWEVLVNYFRLAVVEDKLKSAETILNSLTNPIIKSYFYFLKYVLNMFNQFNAIFQSNKVLIHELHNKSEALLLQICQKFLKPVCFTNQNILTLNIRNPHHLLDINDIYIGQESAICLQSNNISNEDLHVFKNNCLNFYQTSAEEIQKRLFQNNIFESFSFLSPEVALEIEGRIKFPNLDMLCQTFINHGICKTELELEWRNLPFMVSKAQKKVFYSLKIDQLWYEISKLKNFNDQWAYPNLSKLAKIVLCLPHSNAAAERIFSIVTDVKSKKRNRIGHDALNAICIIRSSLAAKESDCIKFKVTENHLKLHSVNMYTRL